MDPNQIVFNFLPLGVFFMFAAGVFYVFSALFLWKGVREKSDLINALITFLSYQAIAKFSMGLGVLTLNPIFGKIAPLAVIIGAAYMLKFPLSVLSASTRKALFAVILAVSVIGYGWLISTPEGQATLGSFVAWYDILLNGVLVGGTIILFGIRSANSLYKTKALGGGSGVVSCCVVGNVAMISGLALTSVVFQFFAPILILGSLLKTKTR